MNNLPSEIMVIILDLLDFKSQIRFIFASKTNKCLTKYWTINKKINVNEKILNWNYYDNLGNILTSKLLDVYPQKLRRLTFNNMFNEYISKKLPSSITHLTFGYWFNRPIYELPISIKYLKFGSKFNQPIFQLPKSVKHIQFGYEFNQSLKNLPVSITHLTVGWLFDKFMDIPSSISHLTVDDHNINYRIPNTITHLKCCSTENIYIRVPSSVTHLTIDNYGKIIGEIPDTVTHLTINKPSYKTEQVPISVTHLTIKGKDDKHDKHDTIPDTVTHLTIDTLKNVEFGKTIPNITVNGIFLGKGILSISKVYNWDLQLVTKKYIQFPLLKYVIEGDT